MVLHMSIRAYKTLLIIFEGICIENGLVVLNNIKVYDRYFKGGKTFKKGNEWVSELDLCFISCNMVSHMNNVKIIYQTELPSDQAPLALIVSVNSVSLKDLESCAKWLGDHSVHSHIPKNSLVKPVNMVNVNLEMLNQKLEGEIPNTSENLDVSVTQMTTALYECVKSSKHTRHHSREESGNVMQNRWERMVNSKNNTEVW